MESQVIYLVNATMCINDNDGMMEMDCRWGDEFFLGDEPFSH